MGASDIVSGSVARFLKPGEELQAVVIVAQAARPLLSAADNVLAA
jgi:hypothetical protein